MVGSIVLVFVAAISLGVGWLGNVKPLVMASIAASIVSAVLFSVSLSRDRRRARRLSEQTVRPRRQAGLEAAGPTPEQEEWGLDRLEEPGAAPEPMAQWGGRFEERPLVTVLESPPFGAGGAGGPPEDDAEHAWDGSRLEEELAGLSEAARTGERQPLAEEEAGPLPLPEGDAGPRPPRRLGLFEEESDEVLAEPGEIERLTFLESEPAPATASPVRAPEPSAEPAPEPSAEPAPEPSAEPAPEPELVSAADARPAVGRAESPEEPERVAAAELRAAPRPIPAPRRAPEAPTAESTTQTPPRRMGPEDQPRGSGPAAPSSSPDEVRRRIAPGIVVVPESFDAGGLRISPAPEALLKMQEPRRGRRKSASPSAPDVVGETPQPRTRTPRDRKPVPRKAGKGSGQASGAPADGRTGPASGEHAQESARPAARRRPPPATSEAKTPRAKRPPSAKKAAPPVGDEQEREQEADPGGPPQAASPAGRRRGSRARGAGTARKRTTTSAGDRSRAAPQRRRPAVEAPGGSGSGEA